MWCGGDLGQKVDGNDGGWVLVGVRQLVRHRSGMGGNGMWNGEMSNGMSNERTDVRTDETT